MADEDKDQRTEEASDKKREDTKKKGRTIHSKEVSSALILLAALTFLYAMGGVLREEILEFMRTAFRTSGEYELNTSSIRPLIIYYSKSMFMIVAPIAFPIMVAGVVASVMQNGGFIFSVEPLSPTLTKLNPIKGFGRIFSKTAVVELIKSLTKIGIVSYLCYWVIAGEWEHIPLLSDQNIEQILIFVTWVGIKLMFYVLLLMIVLAAADFMFQKHTYDESIKMTKQEVKDERKEMEGDPIVKQRIRTAQMAIARRRMMAEVPKAEVVITNPTHIAVALAYDRLKTPAPVVVAKGAGAIARKIKEIAKENDVPIIEDKPLARLLFKTIPIEHSIPEELFRAIAEILAYVYRLKGKAL